MKTERTGPDDCVLVVQLDRPNKLNAMNADEWSALRETCERAGGDTGVRAVVIRGDRRAFCAGNDIEAMVEAERAGRQRAYFLDVMLPAFEAMAHCPVPLIGVVEGLALGGGVELLTFCDLVVAGPEARFGLPETRIGVFATVYLGAMAVVSDRRTGATLALTGEPVGTADAARMGIVTHRVDAVDALDDAVADLVDAIRAGSRDAAARTKAWLNRDLLETGIDRCREALIELCDEGLRTPEYRAAVTRFLQRHRATTPPGSSSLG